MASSFLKWAGGKSKLIGKISPYLKGTRLVEPFVGAGNVFMNLDFDEYLLCDANPDLINVYLQIQEKKDEFIEGLREYFTPETNNEEVYYKLRNYFNITDDVEKKAYIFIYLNRHGFNGLCRYSVKSGFNVPFGKYDNPYFPEKELKHLIERIDKCTFKCQGFVDTFDEVKKGDVVYCDPPYYPITPSSFATYATGGFPLNSHNILGSLSERCKQPVLVSNSDTPEVRKIFSKGVIESFGVQRNISRDGTKRVKDKEVLVYYKKK